ncbi:hemerythrin domain-containing protein [Acidobacteria bacterium AB60]|nr:hemerythrin domain-containing protein [Acidobacteria bacterium AB60]
MNLKLRAPRESRQQAHCPSPTPLLRRSFLQSSAKAAAAAILPATLLGQKPGGPDGHDKYYSVTTNERLMREHGIVTRGLLMYGEMIRRIDARQDFPLETAHNVVQIIRKYFEDYHQKLEDDYILPLFHAYYRRQDVLRLYAQKLLDLVIVLEEQHKAGRRLTDRILATLRSLKTQEDRRRLARDLQASIRMYSPHIVREDTVLYPALHIITAPEEFAALGDKFDEIERKTFGTDGFDMYLDLVTGYEKHLGVYDMAQFTAK